MSASFDLVVSSLALSNIREAGSRPQALREAVRVLRPGGRPRIVDDGSDRYAAVLQDVGCTDVAVRQLDWWTWYGIPGHRFPWSQPPGHPAYARRPWPVRASADSLPAAGVPGRRGLRAGAVITGTTRAYEHIADPIQPPLQANI